MNNEQEPSVQQAISREATKKRSILSTLIRKHPWLSATIGTLAALVGVAADADIAQAAGPNTRDRGGQELKLDQVNTHRFLRGAAAALPPSLEAALAPTPQPKPAETATPVAVALGGGPASEPGDGTEPVVPLVVRVNVENANIRAGAGTDSAIIGTVKKDESVTLAGKNADGSWLAGETEDGTLGWINASLVNPTDVTSLPVMDGTTPPKLEAPTSQVEKEEKVTTTNAKETKQKLSDYTEIITETRTITQSSIVLEGPVVVTSAQDPTKSVTIESGTPIFINPKTMPPNVQVLLPNEQGMLVPYGRLVVPDTTPVQQSVITKEVEIGRKVSVIQPEILLFENKNSLDVEESSESKKLDHKIVEEVLSPFVNELVVQSLMSMAPANFADWTITDEVTGQQRLVDPANADDFYIYLIQNGGIIPMFPQITALESTNPSWEQAQVEGIFGKIKISTIELVKLNSQVKDELLHFYNKQDFSDAAVTKLTSAAQAFWEKYGTSLNLSHLIYSGNTPPGYTKLDSKGKINPLNGLGGRFGSMCVLIQDGEFYRPVLVGTDDGGGNLGDSFTEVEKVALGFETIFRCFGMLDAIKFRMETDVIQRGDNVVRLLPDKGDEGGSALQKQFARLLLDAVNK